MPQSILLNSIVQNQFCMNNTFKCTTMKQQQLKTHGVEIFVKIHDSTNSV